MSIQQVTEILAAHADQLNRGENTTPDALLTALPGERNNVASLIKVATQLKRALKPAPVAPQFRTHLRDELMTAAQHRTSQKILIERRDSPWGWVLGAAALGSAAGLIAIAWRAKSQRQQVAHIVSESARPN